MEPAVIKDMETLEVSPASELTILAPTNGQLVIGMLKYEDLDIIVLNKPRVYSEQPGKQPGQVMCALLEYMGQPTEVKFFKRRLIFIYTSTEINLYNNYIYSTTGLVLANVNTIPFPTKGGKKLS